ncbi:MAG: DedA family protein [Alphaproteobacteria bacterium]|nr:DedA family protein [Alphaproteobacteria bacterium]
MDRRAGSHAEDRAIGDLTDAVLDFIRTHEIWAAPIVLALAFGESLAFVSLVLPSTVMLFAIGGLIGASGIGFWSLWAAASLGAILGDWVSYWLGRRYQRRIAGIWPLTRHPALLPTGEAFFKRWGVMGVFVGRFFGPLRSVVPLVAGIFAMHPVQFQIANVASALVWAAGILMPGALFFGWRL